MSAALERQSATDPVTGAVTVRVHHAAGASAFTRRLGACLADALGGEQTEGLPAPAQGGRGQREVPAIVLAPHEFLAGRPVAVRRALADALEGTVVVSTAEVSEHLGGVVMPLLAGAAVVLDPAAAGVAALRRAGAAPRVLPLGLFPDRAAPRRIPSERPVELGTWSLASPHRLRTLASCGQVLAWRSSRLDLRQGLPRPGIEAPAEHEGTSAELAETRVLLWLPEGDGRALPWRVVLRAVTAGAVLLAEHPAEVAPLEAGRHLAVGAAASIPLLLDALLRDPDRSRQMADDAHACLRAARPWAATLDVVREAVADAARAGGRARARPLPGAEADPAGPRVSDVEAGPLDAAGRDDAVLRRLLLEVAALRRELRQRNLAQAPEAPSWSTPAWTGAQADVSVVLPLHDYAETVAAALDSIAASTGAPVEIVVIDDASADASVAVARSWMDRHPEVPVTLLASPVNAGVAAARNLGVAIARTPLILPLDADDVLYPRGPALLEAALRADPGAAFAYGIVEQGDEDGSYGLLGYGPWQPERLRFGNYITSVALIRRTTLEQVGGWDDRHPLLLATWEDYDLWLRCAAAGLRAAHVPEIVAWYRQGPSSRDRLSEVYAPAVTALLRRRYPSVLARQGRAPEPRPSSDPEERP